jgi:YD repeat-containing protein
VLGIAVGEGFGGLAGSSGISATAEEIAEAVATRLGVDTTVPTVTAFEARTLPAAEYATTNAAAAILSRVLRGFVSAPVGGEGPAAGKVASMTFTDGRVVAFQYDPDDGHLIGSTDTADVP